MKNFKFLIIAFFAIISLLALNGCYTKLAISEDEEEIGEYESNEQKQYSERQYQYDYDDYDRWHSRCYLGFNFYYPGWWYWDPLFYPTYWSWWYDPFYYPYYYYSYYYPGYYIYYPYYPGYYVYKVDSYVTRTSGYRRGGNTRSSYESARDYRDLRVSTGSDGTRIENDRGARSFYLDPSRPTAVSRDSGSNGSSTERSKTTITQDRVHHGDGTGANSGRSTNSREGTRTGGSVRGRRSSSDDESTPAQTVLPRRSDESQRPSEPSYTPPQRTSTPPPSSPAPGSDGGGRNSGSTRSSGRSR